MATSPRRAVLTVLLAALAVAPPVAAQNGSVKKLTLESYLDMESVSNPQASPDGSQIVYTRCWVDKVIDRRESSIWIMNADGSKNRFLVDGSAPVWSPDGTRIAYTASGEPTGSQVFVRWMDDEGATTQITRVENTPSSLRWSPDGERIAFSMTVDEESSWRVQVPGRPSGARWTEDPKVVTRADYRQDRVGFNDEGWRHVFVVPAEGGTPRQLTDGSWHHSAGEWTPDGREILFSSLRTEDAELSWRESEIYSVDVASGSIRQLTTRRGQDSNPMPSPDGKLIAYTGGDWHDDTYRNSQVWVMGRDGSSPRMISGDFDRQASDFNWAPDGSGLYFTANDAGSRNVHFVSLDGGVRQVTEGVHLVAIGSITSGGVLVGTRTSPHEPGDVVSFALDRPTQVRQLTRVNEDVLAGVTLGEVEELWYESVDGYRIQGWIVKPPDFDASTKYPLMLSIHGGPHSMYHVGFNFGFQEHAANGFVLLYLNPRGSTGYGSRFANLIEHAYPGDDYHDLMAGVDLVLERGYVDEDR
ncbi:MAG TPA: DPP IV N-terminal domain-containing protein, partial [Longimicrobiales bacterium]|nr:DPP IV N-terminal domain-containing protein [Longimicrobiales bacterium]